MQTETNYQELFIESLTAAGVLTNSAIKMNNRIIELEKALEKSRRYFLYVRGDKHVDLGLKILDEAINAD